MTRPYFLRRLSGRVVRNVAGINREPIRHPDITDDLAIGVLIFLSGAGLATLVMVGFFGDRLFDVLCGG
ncbi:hypothetical protein [Paraburkholderia elongata]|uniref:Uncharacterized protein n=1 Tax=Paraburkholderia elongata TaxID=2675747 RepID=A0A972NU65_9BURK|nr:hypothetical protein [Paraburkholderia elongata]NPT59047.1 hypothetical protein [Paraburkholderia elongata]